MDMDRWNGADKVIEAMKKLNISIPEFTDSSFELTHTLLFTYLLLNKSISL